MAGWDAYLAVEGVESESQKEGHEGEIEVKAFQFGGSNISSVGQGSGGGTGVVALSEFIVQKLTDASSADLFQKLCTGQHYPTAKVTLYKSGGDAGPLDYLVYDFEEVYVTSINWSGAEGGDPVPHESISFAFGKVVVTYKIQGPDGTAQGDKVGSWDVRTRTP
jgi:type VI secretion system secreted protein Hcp